MKKIGNIIIATILLLSVTNIAIAIECPNDLEIIRFNIDIPKGNSIYFPQGNIIRFAIDSLENLWISNGKSIKLFSTDDGVKYHGKYLVKSGELFAVSSNLLFVFNKGPYYFPKPMNDIEGVLDVYSGIDVYERQKETNLFKIIKSIHEKDSIVENLYGYRFFIDRDNHLVVGKSVGSKIMAIYFNEKLELLYKKKGIYMNKGEKDIYFDRDNVPFDADVPKNKRHGLLILDSDEKILNKYYFENEFDYIRNIYGEIVYVENANELLQFDSDGKIKSEVDISCINKKIYKGLYPNKLVGPNEKLYFSEKDNEDLVIKYIDLKKEDKGQKSVSQKGELE